MSQRRCLLSQLWTAPEIRDLPLAWEAFALKYPHRTRAAWDHKQRERRQDQPLAPPSAQWTAYTQYHATVQAQLLPRSYTVHVETDQPIALTFLSDLHIGGEGVDIAAMRSDFETIARTPQHYLALGGDPTDNFVTHGTSAMQSSDIQIKVQWELLCELLHLVAGKLLFVGSGNHDAWTYELAQIDPFLAVLKGIPTVYTGEGSLIQLTVGTQLYRIFRKHTPSRSRSRKHPTNSVVEELFSGGYDYDIGVLEHEHQPAILQFRHRELDRLAIRCGTYKIRDIYSENLGFSNAGRATPTVILFPHERRFLPFWAMDDALSTLPLWQNLSPITRRSPAGISSRSAASRPSRS